MTRYSRHALILAALVLLAPALSGMHAHAAGIDDHAAGNLFCPECALTHAPAASTIVCVGLVPPTDCEGGDEQPATLATRHRVDRPTPSRAPPFV